MDENSHLVEIMVEINLNSWINDCYIPKLDLNSWINGSTSSGSTTNATDLNISSTV